MSLSALQLWPRRLAVEARVRRFADIYAAKEDGLDRLFNAELTLHLQGKGDLARLHEIGRRRSYLMQGSFFRPRHEEHASHLAACRLGLTQG